MTRSGVRARGQRGVAAIELAIISIFFLVPLAFGLTEFGRAIYQYDALAKSARAAARYLAMRENGANASTYVSEARNVALCGAPACGTGSQPVVPGLTLAHIVAQLPGDSGAVRQNIQTGYGPLDLVTVTISPASNPYRFQSLAPFVVPNLNFGPISVTMPQVF